MTAKDIKDILEKLKSGNISTDDAMMHLRDLPFKDLGFAKIDNHRELRTGVPEVIYCAGKTIDQAVQIFQYINERGSTILGTRASIEQFEAVKKICPQAIYNSAARAIIVEKQKIENTKSYIAVITAGSADIPVAEEAAITAEIFGNKVERIFDVGVAGIHRLFAHMDLIRGAKVVVAVAGMEGALPSVLGGLIDKPIIAVPTSVGYGANFQGLSALLTMLNTCAPGVAVVNIDNGFGAGYMASSINRL